MRLALIGLSLVAPLGAGYGIRSWQARTETVSDGWLFNGQVPAKGSVDYSSEIFEADIPLPNFEAIEAKVKLIATVNGDTRRSRVVAYTSKVRVASLDRKKIPAKYLQTRVEQHRGGPITLLHLEQVTYVMRFSFDLTDKDGFKLGEVIGPDQWVESGKSNDYQEVTEMPLAFELAKRIAKVRTHLHVLRCESCRE